MARSDHQLLRLRCPGCGAVVGLNSSSRLVPRIRPFVEQHRACGSLSDDLDREMKSAFSRSG